VLDAEFDVEPIDGGADVVLHARYGGRASARATNVDYFPALELLLRRLGAVRGVIERVTVDSSTALALPPEDRLVRLDYPIALREDTDFAGLRLALTRGQRTVARSPTATKKGGNNHKRIRIRVRPLPAEVGPLAELLRSGRTTENLSPTLGTTYRRALPDPSVSPADLFTFDPAARERGLTGHARVQNGLADVLRARGIEPRSPRPGEPDFDLAWIAGSPFVAEVKSLTSLNEDQQMRLGLGQILHYRFLLARDHGTTTAVLAVEREPSLAWQEICRELGVILTWPERWPGL
jgi:hypothetical protein